MSFVTKGKYFEVIKKFKLNYFSRERGEQNVVKRARGWSYFEVGLRLNVCVCENLMHTSLACVLAYFQPLVDGHSREEKRKRTRINYRNI